MDKVLMLLTISSAITALATEAIKKIVKIQSANLCAAIVSVIVSGGVAAGYLILTHTPLTAEVWVYVICLVVLSWLCAMLGYDKVKQTIAQLIGGHKS